MADPLHPLARRWSLAVALLCLAPLLLQLPALLGAAIGSCALAVSAGAWRRPLPGALRVVLAIVVTGAVLAHFQLRFGRDTGCALLAAMLAIKASETATLRDGRSLVGFAMFAPFSTFLLDQGPLTLALGLAGIIAALGALQRLAAQEGRVRDDVASLRTALRLVALGLPIAMAVFWLFPRVSSPLWGVPERAQARTGLGDTMSPGDWVDLLADDTVAARALFAGPTPPRQALYWRGPVLTDFDGRTWRRIDEFDVWPPPDVRSAAPVYRYEIEIEPTDRRQLVALDLPRGAPEGTRLTQDFSLRSMRPLSSLTRWQLESAPAAAFEAELRPFVRRRLLALPPGYNPRAIAYGRALRARHGGDPGAMVDEMLALVRRDFRYSLSPPPLGRNGIDEFLFDTREGYCEHYAGAFAVVMRAAGVPARVVTGYVGGYFNRLGGGYWMIRRSDAHAWNELWLPGRGWVRVDPTAAVAPANIYDTLGAADAADGLLDVLAQPEGLAQVGDWLRRGWNDLVLGFDADRQARMLAPLGIERMRPALLAGLLAIAVLAGLLVMLWIIQRGRTERDPLLRAWHRLGRRYAGIGLARAPHEPADAWAERIASALPGNGREMRDLAARFTRSRYAGLHADRDAARGLIRDLRAHRPPRPGTMPRPPEPV